MYVSEELARTMGDKRTTADIVFEYASKSTAVYDRTTKADTYLALGVRELWIVDSSSRTIEVRNAALRRSVSSGNDLAIRRLKSRNRECCRAGKFQ